MNFLPFYFPGEKHGKQLYRIALFNYKIIKLI